MEDVDYSIPISAGNESNNNSTNRETETPAEIIGEVATDGENENAPKRSDSQATPNVGGMVKY